MRMPIYIHFCFQHCTQTGFAKVTNDYHVVRSGPFLSFNFHDFCCVRNSQSLYTWNYFLGLCDSTVSRFSFYIWLLLQTFIYAPMLIFCLFVSFCSSIHSVSTIEWILVHFFEISSSASFCQLLFFGSSVRPDFTHPVTREDCTTTELCSLQA